MSHLYSAPSTPSPINEIGGDTDSAENLNSDTGDSGASDDQPDERTGLRVEITHQGCQLDPSHAYWLRAELLRLAGLLGIDTGSINVAVVGDQRMAALHEQYKNVPGTTDVLTFDLRDNPVDAIEADIAVCWDEAVRQVEARPHDAPYEALLYTLHGLLHLLGYDDHDPAAAAAMHRKEDEVLTAAGFGAVYSGGRNNHQRGGRL